MKRLSVWTVVVVAALVAFAAPASAASTTHINTTDTDFQQASLTNLSISGSGTSASVVGELGEQTATTLTSSGTDRDDAERGVSFTVSESVDTIVVERFAENTITEYELRYSNGTTISSGGALGQTTFEFSSVTFQPGVSYVIVFGDGGDDYDSVVASEAPPVDNGVVNITGGVQFRSSTSILYNVQSIAPKSPTTAEYQGPAFDTDAQTVFADIELTNAEATVEAQLNTGSGWSTVDSTTVSTSQNVSLSVSGTGQWRTVVSFTDLSGTSSVALEDEGVVFSSASPTLSNPDPADGTEISSYDGDISVDISDADFGLQQGDTVTVTASDSEGQIGQDTVTADGTVSVEYTPVGGANDITWTATDSYGNSDTLTQNFTAPAQLRVYNESAPTELVDDVNISVQFYRQNTDEVITKNTSNGIISMAGLPAGEPFFVRAQAENYTARTIYVPSLIESQRLYLLPEDETSVPIVFDHADYSGQYPQDQTVLVVQRELNGSYQTIQGDIFGATGRYSTVLEQDVRHRLVVENVDTGERKILGPYTPFGAEEETVKIVTNGTINVERLPAVAIEPSTRTLVASSNPGLSVTVDNQSTTIASWSVNVTFRNDSTTQLLAATSSASDGGTYDPNLNLSGYANGNVTVEVNWQTEAGETGGQTAVFSVQQFYNNQHSLLAVLGTVGTHIPGQNFDQFTTLLSVFISIFVGVGAGVTLRASTELIGVLVVVTLAGFAVIGWVGYGPVFIGGAGLAAIVGLRRGL